ncbi:hypothetical protein C8R45DRAFT_947115 [Mycena sanguinolenta]|nr:hypothetical protein C8R45DRAFT_947115 [Mycena sanguinolenta]
MEVRHVVFEICSVAGLAFQCHLTIFSKPKNNGEEDNNNGFKLRHWPVKSDVTRTVPAAMEETHRVHRLPAYNVDAKLIAPAQYARAWWFRPPFRSSRGTLAQTNAIPTSLIYNVFVLLSLHRCMRNPALAVPAKGRCSRRRITAQVRLDQAPSQAAILKEMLTIEKRVEQAAQARAGTSVALFINVGLKLQARQYGFLLLQHRE